MATTAAAIGSPNVNTKAATTVATRMARPQPPRPKAGRLNPNKFQNPNAARAAMSATKQRGQASSGPRQFGRGPAPAWQQRPTQTGSPFGQAGGGQVPGQYQTPGRPPGPRFPGDTDWWRNTPQPPPQMQWGSPQFNYQSGYAPSAQPYGGPNWGGGTAVANEGAMAKRRWADRYRDSTRHPAGPAGCPVVVCPATKASSTRTTHTAHSRTA